MTPKRALVFLVVIAVATAPIAGGVSAAVGGSAVGGPAVGGPSTADVTTDTTAVSADHFALDVVEETDDEITMELSTELDGIAGYQAEITYDDDAVSVAEIAGGEDGFDAEPVSNVEDGWAAFNHALGPDGTEDAPVLATVTFTVEDGELDPNVELDGDESLVVDGDGTPIDGEDGDESDEEDNDEDSEESPSTAPSAPSDDDGDDEPSTETVTGDVETANGVASTSASDLSAGDTVESEFDGAVAADGVSVDGLSVTVGEDVQAFDVETQLLADEELPEDVAALDDANPESYVSFETDGFESADVDGATVTFGLEADRLPDDTDADDVSLFRFADGNWDSLETTHEGDGVYSAETPGFSVFAIGTSATDAGADDGDGSASVDGGEDDGDAENDADGGSDEDADGGSADGADADEGGSTAADDDGDDTAGENSAVEEQFGLSAALLIGLLGVVLSVIGVAVLRRR